MRTLLVDEQRMFRAGLCAVLAGHRDVDVVGEAESARQAYDLVRRLGPQLVITELLLPGVDGIAAAREIRRLDPQCKILVLTACKDGSRLQSAWLSGVDAVVTKDETVETLSSAIASLHSGRRYAAPSLRRTGCALRFIDDRRVHGPDPHTELSLREREVFDLIVRGFSTKATARELCISPKTVETHRTHINQKLAVHSTADLVRYAFRSEGRSRDPMASERRKARSQPLLLASRGNATGQKRKSRLARHCSRAPVA
jgi:two-component system, NarL family, response regulator NreC